MEQYPEIVKKIHEGGHLIGTHSYEHVNLSNLTDAAAIEQVDKTNAAIHAIIGEFPGVYPAAVRVLETESGL